MSNMVWSPSVRLYTSENAENIVQRKPGQTLARKPFVDRSVNSKTPDAEKCLKQKQNVTVATATLEKPEQSPKTDLNAEEYMFSFQDVEDIYTDIWPRLTKENLLKILRDYCNYEKDTPPPSPPPEPMFDDINPIFFELPTMDMPQFIDEDVWNETLNVDIPEFDKFEM